MSVKAKNQQQLELENKKERSLLCKGNFLSFYEDIYHLNHTDTRFDYIEHPGAVGILPLQSDGRFLFIHQWRRAANSILLEIPAGRLEPKEDPLECAKRELREETGFQATTFTKLGGIFTAPGFCNEFIHLFLAEDLSPNPLFADDTDQIDLLPLSLNDFFALVKEGKVLDSKTLAAIFLYQQHLLHST